MSDFIFLIIVILLIAGLLAIGWALPAQWEGQ